MGNIDLNRDGRLDQSDLQLDRGKLVIDANFVRVAGIIVSRHTGGEHHISMTAPAYEKVIEASGDVVKARNRLLSVSNILKGMFTFSDWFSGKKLALPDGTIDRNAVFGPESEINGSRFVIRELGESYQYVKGRQVRLQATDNRTFRVGKNFTESHVDSEHIGIGRPSSQDYLGEVHRQLTNLEQGIKDNVSRPRFLDEDLGLIEDQIDAALARGGLTPELIELLQKTKIKLAGYRVALDGANPDFKSINAGLKDLFNDYMQKINKSELNRSNYVDVLHIQDAIGNVYASSATQAQQMAIGFTMDDNGGVRAAPPEDYSNTNVSGTINAGGTVHKVAVAFGNLKIEDAAEDLYAFKENVHENWHFGHKYNYMHGHSATCHVGDKNAYILGKVDITFTSDGDEFKVEDLLEEFKDYLRNPDDPDDVFNPMDARPGGANPASSIILNPPQPLPADVTLPLYVRDFSAGVTDDPVSDVNRTGVQGGNGSPMIDAHKDLDFRFWTQIPPSTRLGELQEKFVNIPAGQTVTAALATGPTKSVIFGHRKSVSEEVKEFRRSSVQIYNGLAYTNKKGDFFSDTHGLFSDLNLSEEGVCKGINLMSQNDTTYKTVAETNIGKVTSKNFGDGLSATFGYANSMNWNRTKSITGASIGTTVGNLELNLAPMLSMGGVATALAPVGFTHSLTKLTMATLEDVRSSSSLSRAQQFFYLNKGKPEVKVWNKTLFPKPKPPVAGAATVVGPTATGLLMIPKAVLAAASFGGSLAGSLLLSKLLRDTNLTSNPDISRLRKEHFERPFENVDAIYESIELPQGDAQKPFSDLMDEAETAGSVTAANAAVSDDELPESVIADRDVGDGQSKFLMAAALMGGAALVYGLLTEETPLLGENAELPDFSPEGEAPPVLLPDEDVAESPLPEPGIVGVRQDSQPNAEVTDENIGLPGIDSTETAAVDPAKPDVLDVVSAAPTDSMLIDEPSSSVLPEALGSQQPLVTSSFDEPVSDSSLDSVGTVPETSDKVTDPVPLVEEQTKTEEPNIRYRDSTVDDSVSIEKPDSTDTSAPTDKPKGDE